MKTFCNENVLYTSVHMNGSNIIFLPFCVFVFCCGNAGSILSIICQFFSVLLESAHTVKIYNAQQSLNLRFWPAAILISSNLSLSLALERAQ